MKRVVVNYACGGWYPRGQARLRESMAVGCPGAEFIGFTDHRNFGSPPHKTVPYAFKTYALMYCLAKGYDEAIFADSSIFAVGSWAPIWDAIHTDGYFFEEAGQWVGTWTKDSVLDKFGVTRDEAMRIPMHSAGFTGLNLRSEIGREFLRRRHEHACDGDSFIGTWGNENGQMSADPRCKGHRHDMSVASLLAHVLGMKYSKGGTYLAYVGNGYAAPKPTVVAYLQPCK